MDFDDFWCKTKLRVYSFLITKMIVHQNDRFPVFITHQNDRSKMIARKWPPAEILRFSTKMIGHFGKMIGCSTKNPTHQNDRSGKFNSPKWSNGKFHSPKWSRDSTRITTATKRVALASWFCRWWAVGAAAAFGSLFRPNTKWNISSWSRRFRKFMA